MPPNLLPLLDHYIALNHARLRGKESGEAHAAIIWRQALIHRHYGAELFSTEGFPDGAIWRWSFPVEDYFEFRQHRAGWTEPWSADTIGESSAPDRIAIPQITSDELKRVKSHLVVPYERFHYRYRAANLAWQAAKSLPDNHPALAGLYNTAGMWLANRDPKAADRFYQAMVRRCAKTEEGRLADETRWFLKELPPLKDLEALPAAFK